MLLNHNIIKVNKILKIKMLKDNGHQLINNIMNQKNIQFKIYLKFQELIIIMKVKIKK